jgi:hypothetical protein
MVGIKGTLAACVLAAGALALTATSASASTIVNSVSPATLSIPANPIGTIAGIDVSTSNDYDWTFALSGGPYGALSQLQASITVKNLPQPQPIALSLFSGAPGSGSLLDTSSYTQGAAIFDVPLAAGNYYIELAHGDIAVDGELVSGSIQLSAVPEPATWAMMLFGVGLVGAGLRVSRRKNAAAMSLA